MAGTLAQIITLMKRVTSLDDLSESADVVFTQFDRGVNVVQTTDTTKCKRYEQSATGEVLANLQRQLREI